MYTFPELLKQIRYESGLTQDEFSKAVGVSEVLITMIETGQKEVSKNFIIKLAKTLKINPYSITPFLFEIEDLKKLNYIEKQLIVLGEKLQTDLIKNKSKLLKKNAAKS